MRNQSYKDKKVMNIGIVSELTGLSQRRIRYYEECNLIAPEKLNTTNRRYSFNDIEKLSYISSKMKAGFLTKEIRREAARRNIEEQLFELPPTYLTVEVGDS